MNFRVDAFRDAMEVVQLKYVYHVPDASVERAALHPWPCSAACTGHPDLQGMVGNSRANKKLRRHSTGHRTIHTGVRDERAIPVLVSTPRPHRNGGGDEMYGFTQPAV